MALEFAVITPLFVPLTMGLYDLSQILLVQRRVALAASSVAQIASTYALQANATTNQMTNAQVWTAATAAFLQLPGAHGALPGAISANYAITVSSVRFTPTSTGAQTYNAHVVWSSYEGNGLPQLRACDKAPTYNSYGILVSAGQLGVTPASSNNVESLSTLPPALFSPPSSMLQPSSIVVADIRYTYQPLFLKFITSNVTLFRSRIISPRIGASDTYVRFTGPTTGAARVTVCS